MKFLSKKLIYTTTFLLVIFYFVLSSADIDLRTDLSEPEKIRVNKIVALTKKFNSAEKYESMSGGAGTSKAGLTANAFSFPGTNLSFESKQNFLVGNGLFTKIWVSSPSSTVASDGIGPLFNARSCQRCHLKDGRGHPPVSNDDSLTSMVFVLSSDANESEKKLLRNKVKLSIGDPIFGNQIQDFSVPGLLSEGVVHIKYSEEDIHLNGGEIIKLRKPEYKFKSFTENYLDESTIISGRIAQQMIGLGLLEAIHDADIISNADPYDSDKDGISGKINWIPHPITNQMVIGKFGWKASTSSIREQSATAFNTDMGLSNDYNPNPWGDCTVEQQKCLSMPTGINKNMGQYEVSAEFLDFVTFYAKNLAVPARRKVNNENVLKGKKIFYESGCTGCHTPKYVTSKKGVQKEHMFQLIWPYTDLLLHDMGEGLADGHSVGDASGSEWRTPPLWGIGATKKVSGHTFFLHDGRARNLLEAILWHGGEAELSKQKIIKLKPIQRKYLLEFLNSL